MPPAIAQAAERAAPASEQASALTLHTSPAQLRLKELEKEHARLLRDIAKKKVVRDATEHAARDAASALEARVRPLRESFFAVLGELRAIFSRLLGEDSPLNRRDKARVRRLYMQILPGLEADEPDEGEDPWSQGGAAPSDDEGPFGGGHRGGRASDAEAGYSAAKPSEKNASSLRALFRKLAVALHPDKVQDTAQREAFTAVMKEITRAYETGDVARLLELERTWMAQVPLREHEDELGRRIALLLQANKELRRQLRALTAELKDLKYSVPGMQPGRARGTNVPFSPTAEARAMIEEMERELARIQVFRDFSQSFVDGTIGITEFLMGPPHSSLGEDPLEQLIAEMLEGMMDEPAPRRRAPSRRKKSRR